MPHEFKCPSCAVTLRTPAPIPAGKKVRCPKCNAIYVQPAAAAPPRQPAQPPKAAPAAAKPPARQAPAARPAPAPAVEEVLEAPEVSGPQQARAPRRPSLLGRLPRKIRKAVVQGMMLAVLGGLLLYGLVLAATFPAFDRALSKANELARNSGPRTTVTKLDPAAAAEAAKIRDQLVGKWTGPDGEWQFSADGSVLISAPGNPPARGGYQVVDPHTVQIETQGGGPRTNKQMLQVQVSQDTLVLTDANNLMRRYQRSTDVAVNKDPRQPGTKPPQPPDDTPKPPSEPATEADKPWKPSAAEEAAAVALRKLDAFPNDKEDGWDVDLSHVKDLKAALELLPRLGRIAGIEMGDKATDANVAAFLRLKGLRRLQVTFNKNVTDAGFEHLAEASGLTLLNITYLENVTSATVARLAGLTQLESLNLAHIKLGKEGTKPLARLRRLRSLDLSGCELTEGSLAPLAEMAELRELKLSSNEELTGPELQHLSRLSRLEKLELNGTKVDDGGLSHLAGLTSLTLLHMHSTAITDEGLAHLKAMTKMVYLDVGGSGVKGPGLQHLAGMKALVSLEVGRQPDFTGEGLQHLAGCPQLTELNLSWTGVTDAGLAQVKHLQQLTKLDLPPYGTGGFGDAFWQNPHPERLTDKGLEHVGTMTGLKWLWISGSGITDAGLAHIARLKNLGYLGFGYLPNVKGPGLEHLKGLTKLDSLDLQKTGITDENMKYVKDLTQIKSIDLPQRLTDAGITAVKGMKGLESIKVFGGVSDKAVADLKKAFPKAEITHDPSRVVENTQPEGPPAKQEAASKALQKLEVEAGYEGKDGWFVDLSAATDLDAALKLVPQLEKVSTLQLGGPISDAQLGMLVRLKGLQRLYLYNSDKITDAGLAPLQAAGELKQLDLGGLNKVTAAGIAHLAGLEGLQQLGINQMPLKDSGTKPLGKLKELRNLRLVGCSLNDEALAPLAGLGELRELSLNGNKEISGAGLKNLAGLTRLTSLDLSMTGVDDAGLGHLAGQESLVTLILYESKVTDAGLSHLTKMTRMTSLNLALTGVKGPGLQHLAGMKDVYYLGVGNDDFTGEGMQHLRDCKKLTRLDLTQTGVTDAGLAQIKQLKQVTSLHLPPYGQGTGFRKDPHPERFSDKGLAHVGEMTQLQELTFSGSGISDEGLAHLAKLNELRYLGFGYLPNVKGPGLEHLKGMKQLSSLSLMDTGVTDDGMKYLKGLPQLTYLALPKKATDAALGLVKELKKLEQVTVFKGVSEKAVADLKKALPKAQVFRQTNE